MVFIIQLSSIEKEPFYWRQSLFEFAGIFADTKLKCTTADLKLEFAVLLSCFVTIKRKRATP
jgi:hypothetical protein